MLEVGWIRRREACVCVILDPRMVDMKWPLTFWNVMKVSGSMCLERIDAGSRVCMCVGSFLLSVMPRACGRIRIDLDGACVGELCGEGGRGCAGGVGGVGCVFWNWGRVIHSASRRVSEASV